VTLEAPEVFQQDQELELCSTQAPSDSYSESNNSDWDLIEEVANNGLESVKDEESDVETAVELSDYDSESEESESECSESDSDDSTYKKSASESSETCESSESESEDVEEEEPIITELTRLQSVYGSLEARYANQMEKQQFYDAIKTRQEMHAVLKVSRLFF
jgi:hypothetical protein